MITADGSGNTTADAWIRLYTNLVKRNIWKIESVPEGYREAVKAKTAAETNRR